MGDYSQIQRLIRILQIMSSGRKVTTKEIAHRFNGVVSLRTLQRDMLALSEAGIPIVSEKVLANENVWYLMSHFRSFIPIPLEMNEYLAAHILKANLNVFRNVPFDNEVQSLIRKIEQLVPEEVFLESKRTAAEDVFESYAAGMFDYTPFGSVISDLITAILNKNRCEVTYFNVSENREKTYHIEPEKLVYYSGGLYVIAYVRHYKEFILLAIQRIRTLTRLDRNFPSDHPFDENKFWKGKFGLFSGEQVEVKLRFTAEIRHHIEGRIWHSTQDTDVDKKGNFLLTMNVAITPELVAWIMGWHRNVKVLKPEALVNEIKKNAEEINNLY